MVDPDQELVEADPAHSRVEPHRGDQPRGDDVSAARERDLARVPTTGRVAGAVDAGPGARCRSDANGPTRNRPRSARSSSPRPYGRSLDRDDERAAGSIVWFGTGWGPGDPYRWSPVNVELLLADWIPRKIVAEPSFLAKAPNLLRAFIRYCHDRRASALI